MSESGEQSSAVATACHHKAIVPFREIQIVKSTLRLLIVSTGTHTQYFSSTARCPEVIFQLGRAGGNLLARAPRTPSNQLCSRSNRSQQHTSKTPQYIHGSALSLVEHLPSTPRSSRTSLLVVKRDRSPDPPLSSLTGY